jgi:hypothetical protein
MLKCVLRKCNKVMWTGLNYSVYHNCGNILVKKKNRGLMMRRQAPVEWQGRSSDLTASELCRWGYLTALVYVE